jgi:ABC-2 type transport system permease protein
MSKIAQIIAREYITRVRKRVFIVMSIIGPLLFGALMIVPIWIATLEDNEEKTIAIIELDETNNPVADSLMLFKNVFESKPKLKFVYPEGFTQLQAEAIAITDAYYGILIIKHSVIFSGDKVSVEYLGKKQPSMGIEMEIEKALETYLYNRKLLTYNVPPSVLSKLKSDVTLVIKKVDEKGNKSKASSDIQRGIGYASGFLVYMFIFFFGAQVMRGVVEEKTNRIIEVIVTSVKPFQLMMGKIIGIGLVGLTQFLAWIILSIFIYQFSSSYIMREKLEQLQTEQVQGPTDLFQAPSGEQPIDQPTLDDVELSGLMRDIQDVDFVLILGVFLFYFVGGFMLYGAMFAAIGAAVDSETDTQQFMLPVTIPLVISIIVMMNAITNPEGQVAFWFSLIPFTSPIVMMARIGYGIPIQQFFLSAFILIVTILLFIWISGRIYRTGILLYGKKITYRDMFKWIKQS